MTTQGKDGTELKKELNRYVYGIPAIAIMAPESKKKISDVGVICFVAMTQGINLLRDGPIDTYTEAQIRRFIQKMEAAKDALERAVLLQSRNDPPIQNTEEENKKEITREDGQQKRNKKRKKPRKTKMSYRVDECYRCGTTSSSKFRPNKLKPGTLFCNRCACIETGLGAPCKLNTIRKMRYRAKIMQLYGGLQQEDEFIAPNAPVAPNASVVPNTSVVFVLNESAIARCNQSFDDRDIDLNSSDIASIARSLGSISNVTVPSIVNSNTIQDENQAHHDDNQFTETAKSKKKNQKKKRRNPDQLLSEGFKWTKERKTARKITKPHRLLIDYDKLPSLNTMWNYVQSWVDSYREDKKQKQREEVIERLDQLQQSIDVFKKKQNTCIIDIAELKKELIKMKEMKIPIEGLRSKLSILHCKTQEYARYTNFELMNFRAMTALKTLFDGKVNAELLKKHTQHIERIHDGNTTTNIVKSSDNVYNMESIISDMDEALHEATTEITNKDSLSINFSDDDENLEELFTNMVYGKSAPTIEEVSTKEESKPKLLHSTKANVQTQNKKVDTTISTQKTLVALEE